MHDVAKPGSSTPSAFVAEFLALLERQGALEPDVRGALAAAAEKPTRWVKGDCLIEQEQPVSGLSFVCRGVAIATRRLIDGRQQNLGFYTPGEVLDPSGFTFRRAGHFICAVTNVVTVTLPEAEAALLLETHPQFTLRLMREMAAVDRRHQEWIVSLGRRSAFQRCAHLMCELRTRMLRAGEAQAAATPLPLTQSELADTLGLSVVHVNRVLQQLRGADLMDLRRGALVVKDWAGLTRAAGFRPDYLRADAVA